MGGEGGQQANHLTTIVEMYNNFQLPPSTLFFIRSSLLRYSIPLYNIEILALHIDRIQCSR